MNQSLLSCTQCSYSFEGIDLQGRCPECGREIIEDCLWCDYDLTNTSPDANCPECGVPVLASISQGALANVPIETLKSVHKGMKLVTLGILVYIVVALISMILVGWLAVTTLQPNSTQVQSTSLFIATIISTIINNGIFGFVYWGWLKLSQPLEGVLHQIDAPSQRTFIRVMTYIMIVSTIIGLVFAFIPQGADGHPIPLQIVQLVFGFAAMIIWLIFFIASVMYIGWIAKLVRNKKMAKRAKHLVWSGPVISIVGFFLLFLGPLITLILYWNMIEYTRRDLKKMIECVTV